MRILYIWNESVRILKENGTRPENTELENLTISWVNIISVLFAFMSIPYLINTTVIFFWINIIACVFNLLPLYFNKIHKPLTAKLLLILPPIGVTIIAVLLFHPFSWVSLFMVAMQVASFLYLPFVVFTLKEEKYMYISVATAIAGCIVYVIIGYNTQPPFPDKNVDVITIFWAIFLSFIITVILGIAYYRKLLLRYTEKLLVNQTLLLSTKAELQKQKETLDSQNDSLQSLNGKLSGSLEHSKEFLQMVSHDLKSPVNAIIGLTDIIQAETDLLKIRQYNEYVLHSAQKALHLIENLRQITMLESNNFEINKKAFMLDKLIEEVIEQNKINAHKKGQKIESLISCQTPAILDPVKTYQIVDNVLNNAVKYSPKNSTIKISLSNENNQNTIRITDNGPGFTPDEYNKLFQKFSKLNAKPTGNEISTGLGLFISKRLIELQGGKIYAESEGKNKGSTFVIEFPAIQN
ncbi:MAG: HAMP domain-containing histidine kinase [Bacteroidia bacterium]|nr:HAMP domain-containing histidine kinase [Bacteroidia bacterium]